MLPDSILPQPEDDIARQLARLQKSVERLERLEGPGAWAVAISAFSLLPQLRGLWPMSSVDNADSAFDFSEQNRTMTANGGLTYAVDGLIPYAVPAAATNRFLSRADEAALDITGNITWGGWNWVDATSVANQGFMAKWSPAAGQRAYAILYRRDGLGSDIEVTVSVDGAATYVLNAARGAPDFLLGQWQFTVGRFIPSTELALFHQGTFNKRTDSGPPAAIFNSNQALRIGSLDGVNEMTGRLSTCFLCATDLSDTIIETLFQTTRGLYGV